METSERVRRTTIDHLEDAELRALREEQHRMALECRAAVEELRWAAAEGRLVIRELREAAEGARAVSLELRVRLLELMEHEVHRANGVSAKRHPDEELQ